VLAGMPPLRRPQATADVPAGLALAVPQALGYAKIAGMPVETGLYTPLIPMAMFAIVGSSRHLVVSADSRCPHRAGTGGLPVRHESLLRQRVPARRGRVDPDRAGSPLRWMLLDAAAIDDIDYTGGPDAHPGGREAS